MKRNLIVGAIIVLVFVLSIYLSHRQATLQQRRLEIRARHILVKVDRTDPVKQAQALEKIKELRERILAGEDFATVAKEQSEDVMTAPMGGDLGFMDPDELEKTFKEALLNLEKGEISDVVETSYGYHIIQVLDKRGPVKKP
jgi:parvulin-like peptidyl-prolyl isomerase